MPPASRPETVADELEEWLAGDASKTLGGLVELFGEKSFALLFVLLLAVPALPLPTGGATHVFEVIATLLALELIAGRREVWLPRRWCAIDLGGGRRREVVERQLRAIRRLERLARPRGRILFGHRLSSVLFGVVVVAGCAGAFFAPPFTGLDTLPALGVVLVSLGVLLEDIALVAVGVVVIAVGVVLEIVLGRAALKGLRSLF